MISNKMAKGFREEAFCSLDTRFAVTVIYAFIR